MSDTRAQDKTGFTVIENEFIPWTLWYTKVADAKVVLISTGGVYLKNGLHQPFDMNPDAGDSSFREFSTMARSEDLAVAAGSFDLAAAQEDVNVVFPLERLRELASAGYIGTLAPFAYSFTAEMLQPISLLSNYAPSVAYRLKRMGADVALVLAVGGQAAHQTAALVARAVELAGVPTVVVGTDRAVLEAVKPPRTVLVTEAENAPLGRPGATGKQQHLIRTALDVAWGFEAAGGVAQI